MVDFTSREPLFPDPPALATGWKRPIFDSERASGGSKVPFCDNTSASAGRCITAMSSRQALICLSDNLHACSFLRVKWLPQVRKARLTYSRHAMTATLHHIRHGLLACMDATTNQLLRELKLAYQGGPAEQQWPHGAPAIRPLGPALTPLDEAQVLGPPRRAAWGQGVKGPRAPRINGPPPRLAGRCVIVLFVCVVKDAVFTGHAMGSCL